MVSSANRAFKTRDANGSLTGSIFSVSGYVGSITIFSFTT